MTRERTKELLPILQAFANGKNIESRKKNMETHVWLQEWNFHDDPEMEYRIKPAEPRELFIARGMLRSEVFNDLQSAELFVMTHCGTFEIFKVREVL